VRGRGGKEEDGEEGVRRREVRDDIIHIHNAVRVD